MVSTFLCFEISAGVKTNLQKLNLSTKSSNAPRKDSNFRELRQHSTACTCDTLFKAIARLYLAGFSADNHARICPKRSAI
jgi:hypothetical protein